MSCIQNNNYIPSDLELKTSRNFTLRYVRYVGKYIQTHWNELNEKARLCLRNITRFEKPLRLRCEHPYSEKYNRVRFDGENKEYILDNISWIFYYNKFCSQMHDKTDKEYYETFYQDRINRILLNFTDKTKEEKIVEKSEVKEVAKSSVYDHYFAEEETINIDGINSFEDPKLPNNFVTHDEDGNLYCKLTEAQWNTIRQREHDAMVNAAEEAILASVRKEHEFLRSIKEYNNKIKESCDPAVVNMWHQKKQAIQEEYNAWKASCEE